MTQQHPDAGFSVSAAMARNKLIYGLADLTVVIAADERRGGTWSGAEEALRKGHGRVAVWRGPGEGPGNAVLERMGAVALRSVEDLEALVRSPGETAAPQQLTML